MIAETLLRRLCAASRVALCVIASAAAIGGPASADPLSDCNSTRLRDAISGCSRIISGPSPDKKLLLAAYHNRGLAYARGSQWGRALADFDKLIGLKPDIASYYLDRANVLLARGERDRAILDYDQAIRLSPGYSEAYLARGLVNQSAGDFLAALIDYENAARRLQEGKQKDSAAVSLVPEILLHTMLPVANASTGTGATDGLTAYERGDYAAAERSWRPLAEAGDKTATIGLANLYWTGRAATPGDSGREAAYREAAKWYRKAAEQGVADAQLRLGDMYRNGLGIAIDLGEAVGWFRRASDLGSKDADLRLDAMKQDAVALAAAGDDLAAISIWRPLAERGDLSVAFNLARSLLIAGAAPKSPAEIRGWLEKSADLGNPQARYLVETFYGSGSTPERGDRQAAAWLKRAGDQLRKAVAAYDRADFQSALNLFVPLARYGEVSAQSRIGEIYEKGGGVARDFGEALKWYRLAADQGDANARTRVEVGDRFYAGLARYNDGDFTRALLDFDTVVALDPRFADAFDLRGWAHSTIGHRDLAIDDFDRARRLHEEAGWVENAKLPEVDMQVVIVRGNVGCTTDCPEWISAEGKIVAATVGQFKRVLSAMGDKRLPVIIRSPGGDVTAALAIGRLIRAKKLAVTIGGTLFEGCYPGQPKCVVPKGGYRGMAYSTAAMCASACPLILSGGVERVVGRTAIAAVHQVKTVYSRTVVTYEEKYQIVNGRKVIISKKPVARKSTSRESVTLSKQQQATLSGYLRDMGIDQSLIEIMTDTPYETVHRLTPAELGTLHVITNAAEGEILIDPKRCSALEAARFCGHAAPAGG